MDRSNLTPQERSYTADLLRHMRASGVHVHLAPEGELTKLYSMMKPENTVDFLKSEENTVYGWFKDGEIFLAKEGINPNTPLHEYTHAFMLALSKEQPKRYDNIVRDLKTSEVWEEVENDEAYANIIKDPARLASEVAARIVGRESEKRASEGLPDKVMRAIQDLLDYIKEKIGWKEPLTPRQLTNIVIKDISNPVNIFRSRFDAPEGQKYINNIPSPIFDLLEASHGKEYADTVSKAIAMSMQTDADGQLVIDHNMPVGLLALDREYQANLAKAASLVTGDNYTFECRDDIVLRDSSEGTHKYLSIPEDMRDYFDSLYSREDLMSGHADLLPNELGKRYSAWENATEEYISMRESGLVSIVDVKAQRNLVSEKFREYRDAFSSHLGIEDSVNIKSARLSGERFYTKNGEKQTAADYAFMLSNIVKESVNKDIEAGRKSLSLNHVEMMAGHTAKPNMNINDLIFSRTQPDKKLEIIKGMSDSEIMRLTEDSATKMVKEAGRARYKSRDKELYISRSNRAGNQWNSTIDSFYTHKGKLQLSAYIQYENTDTNDSESYSRFFGRGNYEGQFRAYDRRGNERSYYYTYDEHDKANVLRSLLLQYVNVKYAEKLKEIEQKKMEEKNTPKVPPEAVKGNHKPEQKSESKPKEEPKPKVEPPSPSNEVKETASTKEPVSMESKTELENMFKAYNLDSDEKIDKMIEHFKSLGGSSSEINVARLERLKEFRAESAREPQQLDLFKDHKPELSENKLLYDRICDEAEKKITGAGYGHGYAEDLGIGLGEYTYDKNPDNDLNHFEFITPEGDKFEAMYDTIFDEVSFTNGVVRGGMYETSPKEWMQSLDSKLQATTETLVNKFHDLYIKDDVLTESFDIEKAMNDEGYQKKTTAELDAVRNDIVSTGRILANKGYLKPYPELQIPHSELDWYKAGYRAKNPDIRNEVQNAISQNAKGGESIIRKDAGKQDNVGKAPVIAGKDAEPVHEVRKDNNPKQDNQDNQQNKMAKKNYTENADGRSAEDRALDKFAELMIQKVETLQGDWKKPWFTPGVAQPPKNLSGRAYNGMNSIILMMQQENNGWETNRYATFDRIIALNYEKNKEGTRVPATDAEGNKLPQISVNKGEKSTPVFLTIFNVVDPETKERINYDDYKRLTEEERAKYNVYPKLQVYNVFNLSQTNMKEARPEMYEKFLNETKGEIRQSSEGMASFPAIDTMIDKNLWYCPIKPTKGDDAYYSISKDEIVIPVKEQFVDGESFYSNLLHEMAHSSGADGRLNRLKPTSFGSEAYAREELVAELTAALVSSQHGMEKHVKEDSAAYLKNWIDSLKKSPDFIKTTLMDVKKASSVINNRINAVNMKIEQGEKADYSDIREQNKTFSAGFSQSGKPAASQHSEEQKPVAEEKQEQVSQSNTEAAKNTVQSFRHR